VLIRVDFRVSILILGFSRSTVSLLHSCGGWNCYSP